MSRHASSLCFLVGAILLALPCPGAGEETGMRLAELYRQQVDRRLELPEAEQNRYAKALHEALAAAGLEAIPAQYIVMVDRSARVQAAMIYWKSEDATFRFIGASPASTGQPGRFEHFETPLGVFDHTLDNLDFRAEGTRNELGVLGYGRKGMRIYDFGWVSAPKGWGNRVESVMRLQLHSTDPDLLEPRVGSAQSKGCIRIPASLNRFIDRYGILDRNYERGLVEGRSFWVLSPDREPTPWSGQYLVVIDTMRQKRPAWSPQPRSR